MEVKDTGIIRSAWKLMVLSITYLTLSLILTSTNIKPARAQSGSENWTSPTLIYSRINDIYEPYVIVGQDGIPHIFWFSMEESAINDNQDPIGQIYSLKLSIQQPTLPNDIFVSTQVNSPIAAITSDGQIHLVWHGPLNQLLYSHALLTNSMSARAWSTPVFIEQTNLHAFIATDKGGRNLYLVYPRLGALGPYYQYSTDSGNTWSVPVNISRTSNEGSSADYVRLAISDNGVIHVVWTEWKLPTSWPPTGVFYSKSTDGGRSWINPIKIAGDGYDQINVALISENIIHVAWNGSAPIGGRYHRWSTDGGETWSYPDVINQSGGTEGTPQMVVDSNDTLHLLTTGDGCVWYSYWENQRWAVPYCISKAPHIEQAALAIGEGNQLYAVFWHDLGNIWQLWYSTKQTLAPNIPAISYPTLIPTRTISSLIISPTILPRNIQTPIEVPSNDSGYKSENPLLPIMLGILPVIFFIGCLIIIQIYRYKFW